MANGTFSFSGGSGVYTTTALDVSQYSSTAIHYSGVATDTVDILASNDGSLYVKIGELTRSQFDTTIFTGVVAGNYADIKLKAHTTGASAPSATYGAQLAAIPVNGVQTGRTLTAGTGLTGGGDLSADRTFALAGTIVSAPQALTGAGAVNVTAVSTLVTASGVGDALTLANGSFTGQRKYITGTAGYTSGHTSVITPTTFADGTRITLATKFDGVLLQWSGATWNVLALFGGAAVS